MQQETNYLIRKFIVILMAAVMIFSAMAMPTYASTAQGSGYSITSSTGPIAKIRQNDTIAVKVSILVPSGTEGITEADISRVSDGFNNGTVAKDVSTSGNTLVLNVTGLKYKGGAKELSLFVKNGTAVPATYDQVTFTITECYSNSEAAADAAAANAAWEANKPQVKTYTKPTIIFSRGDLIGNIKAKETRTITVTAKNTSKRSISNAILSVTTSESLMIQEAQTSFELGTIAAGASATKEIKVKAFDRIASQNQYLDVTLNYDYISNSENDMAQASDSFKISVPATVTGESTDGKAIDAPVPNIIITGFDYGGKPVAANSEINLSLSFKNTGKKLAVENVVATVDSGADFTINGGMNTFYFEKIRAGQTKSVTLPLKVSPSITMSANTVSLSFTYEYVDNNVRKQGTANLKVSVPEYQPDKFKLDAPVVPMDAAVGMETAITVNYVNKGKTAISNVAASVSGDIFTERPDQVIGNIESGKNGTIVFAITPNNAGENSVKIEITYEDSNGDTKKREFDVKLNAIEFMPPDMPETDPGDMMEPEDNTGKILGLPKWVFFVVLIIAAIAGLIVFKKKRKNAKIKKQEALWAKWDEEESAKETASATSESEMSSAATEDGGDK